MRKTFISLVVFLSLCLGGVIIGVMGYEDVNPTSLLMYNDTVSIPAGPIIPARGVHGQFIATENNLAIVRIRLRTYNRLNTTHLTFRIRPKGEEDWLVTNTYTLDRVPDGLMYPFGFPNVVDSKNKMFEFELSSPDGTQENAVGVSGGYHGLAVQYVQPLPLFAREKLISIVRDPYSILYFGMFIVPALMFMFKKYRRYFFAYLLIVYTYLPVSMHSNLILFVAVTELFVGDAFMISILLLLQIPITIVLGNTLAADRLATLVFFSLAVGGIMAVRELMRK